MIPRFSTTYGDLQMYRKQGWGKRFYCLPNWKIDTFPQVRSVFGVMRIFHSNGRIS